MTDRPAMPVVNKEHSSEQLLGGHLGLNPGCAVIVRVEDMPTITHGDQALTQAGNIQQQALVSLGRGYRVMTGVIAGSMQWRADKHQHR